MFLRQIVLQRSIPFEMKLPQEVPAAYQSLTKEQFDKEMEEGMAENFKKFLLQKRWEHHKI